MFEASVLSHRCHSTSKVNKSNEIKPDVLVSMLKAHISLLKTFSSKKKKNECT